MATLPPSAKAVFDESVEIASPEARRDYLERASGTVRHAGANGGSGAAAGEPVAGAGG